MTRMMPGRVRQEGIELYEKGELLFDKKVEDDLFLTVAGQSVQYGLGFSHVNCSCPFFGEKGYCPHLAAVEYFLKNDAEGKGLLVTLEENEVAKEEEERANDQGSLFLDCLLSPLEDVGVKYCLAVEGSLHAYDQQLDWTLKIRRLPDSRFYVVRDIGLFLLLVRRGDYYQLGKQYYEQMAYEHFDPASQYLLDFLWEFIPERPSLESPILVHFGRHLRLPGGYFEEGVELLTKLSQFSFVHQQVTYSWLEVEALSGRAGLFSSKVIERPYDVQLQVTEKAHDVLMAGRYLLVEGTCYRLSRKQEQTLQALRTLPLENGKRVTSIAHRDRDRLALSLLDLEQIGPVSAPSQYQVHDFQVLLDLSLVADKKLDLEVRLQFQDRQVESNQELLDLPYSYHYQHLQDLFALLKKCGFEGGFHSVSYLSSMRELYVFIRKILPVLESLGQLTLSDQLQDRLLMTPPDIQVDRRGSLLDISFGFAGISQEEVQEAVAALVDDQDFYVSQSGQFLVFDEETKKISQSLLDLRARFGEQGNLQLAGFAGYQLAGKLEGKRGVRFSKDFQELAYDLAHPEDFEVALPNLTSSLRDYQELGVRWLSMLDHYGFGGILADDMGLGKTLQTIAFLTSRLTATSRVLILAPSSLLYNWQAEWERFAPAIQTTVVAGSKDERRQTIEQGGQVLITSYPSFRQDWDNYQVLTFDYLILDEAQVMKNAQTKIAKLLRDFEVGNCFALSGTPIENHLTELWSLFQIVLPGLLPAKKVFAKQPHQEIAKIIRPFILRRHKEEVLEELPDLTETTVFNDLSDQQKVVYLAHLQQMQQLVSASSDQEISRRKIEILAGITRLRQICDTPELFMSDYRGGSGKMDSLLELLRQLKEGQHRVLIFSQFRGMLDRIEQALEELGMAAYKLTGSTPAKERQDMTRAFNEGDRDAFLISLKAGGVGLNLTGADRVILVDLWWNPAVEAQAISRAHRMGQTEKVECYRLITRGTIEERILALQETKKDLVRTVLDGNEHRSSLSPEDIRVILGLSSQE